MKKIVIVFLFMFVFSLVGYSPLLADENLSSNSPLLLGRVSLVQGVVKIKDPANGEFVKADLGSEVRVGYLLKVEKESKVEICYLDGSVIRFKENSKVQFQPRSLRLFTGKVWLRVMKLGKKFEVVTPTFVAGVRGTVFSVEANKKNLGRVSVYEGTVYSKTKDANVDVTAGNHVSIAPTGNISPLAKNEKAYDTDFKESDWQANDRRSAYKRYLMLLLKGIDKGDLNSKASEKILKKRKQMPEVQNAYFTYESFSDALE